MRDVYVAGVGMTRFAKQPELSLKDLTAGAVGAALGIDLSTLLQGAGYAQQKAGTSTPSWGTWYGGAPYGDDPADQAQIIAGFAYFQAVKSGCN